MSTVTQYTSQEYTPYGSIRELFYSQVFECLVEGVADSGKSRGACEKLYICAHKYPGMRALIARKTRRSLTQSTMVTFERKVLPPRSLVHFHTTKQAYIFPNESEIVVGGLDDPDKVQSSEYDMIYLPEATEDTEHDIEMVSKLLRNGKMPYQQLIMDCNPSYPSHWLNKRFSEEHCREGRRLRLRARHSDNPSITPERIALLQALTGVRRKRLYEGIWAAAEGLIYETYDPVTHLLDKCSELLPSEFASIEAGVDWGFTKPGVIQVWGFDGDGRGYMIHEVYRCQQDVDTFWIATAKRLRYRYGIKTFYCDPSEPGNIRKFIDAGLEAVPANNEIQPGFDTVRAMMKIAGDGRPRLYIVPSALEERDTYRSATHQPCGLVDELEAYVFQINGLGITTDQPATNSEDHACDAMRYVHHSRAVPRMSMNANLLREAKSF